jgi:hypothetical protein
MMRSPINLSAGGSDERPIATVLPAANFVAFDLFGVVIAIALVLEDRPAIARKLMHCRMVIVMTVRVRSKRFDRAHVLCLPLTDKPPIRRMARAEGNVCLFADALAQHPLHSQ